MSRLIPIALMLAAAALAGCSRMKTIAGSPGSDAAIATASSGPVAIAVHSVAWGGKRDRHGESIATRVELTATNTSRSEAISTNVFRSLPDEHGTPYTAIPIGFFLTTHEFRWRPFDIGPIKVDEIHPPPSAETGWEGTVLAPGQSVRYALFFHRVRIFDETRSVTLTVGPRTVGNPDELSLVIPVEP